MSSWSTGTNVIKEVDTNKNLTCQMFEVRKQGGGTEYLVRKSDVTLGTKSVTQNGTYTAASAGKYGFSQFSVNVRGGNGSADSHGKPTGGDIKPGGAGSAVTGTDPETGEEVVVGVDEGGNIVKTPIPYGIKIVSPPTKTDYEYQETMDYSGIGVKLTNKNGDTYTDVDHPSGWYVNPADLIFPVEKAPAAGGGGIITNGSGVNAIIGVADSDMIPGAPVFPGTFQRVSAYPHAAITPGATIKLTYYNGIIYAAQYTGYIGFLNYTSGESAAGEWSYYSFGDTFSAWSGSSDKFDLPESTVDPTGVDVNTLHGVTATIPVQWLNPYTGETHQDTFEITSTPAAAAALRVPAEEVVSDGRGQD